NIYTILVYNRTKPQLLPRRVYVQDSPSHPQPGLPKRPAVLTIITPGAQPAQQSLSQNHKGAETTEEKIILRVRRACGHLNLCFSPEGKATVFVNKGL